MKFKNILKSAVALIVMAVSVSTFAITEKTKTALMDRLTPAGKVCMAGNPKCEVAVSTGEPREGSVVYEASCVACHGTGAAGAPKLGDSGAWASRKAQGKATLYDHAINGIRAMPAKGACASCSEDEIKAAVDYMTSKS